MSIFHFNKKVIFDVEDSLPDPIEQKFRFRRRIMGITFLGALVLLAIPVINDRIPAVKAANATRNMAQSILDAQVQAANSRHAVFLQLNAHKEWEIFFLNTDSCKSTTQSAAQSHTPPQRIFSEKILWKMKLNEKEISSICFQPAQGLFVDSQALQNQEIKITVTPEEDADSNRMDRMRKISLSNSGILLFPKNT